MGFELTDRLGKIGALRVKSWSSTRKYQGSTKSGEEIGRELNVGTVLEGSVRRAANGLRITAQLIDVQSQEQLWSDQYEGRSRYYEFTAQGSRAAVNAFERALQIDPHYALRGRDGPKRARRCV